MRIFIALLFPEAIKEKLYSVINECKDNFPGNYTAYNNLHLTLHYLGEVSEDKLNLLKESIKEIEFPSFTYTAKKIDSFKNNKAKKIVHLRVEKSTYLKMLHQKVINLLYGLGFELENTNFTPHITLGRKVEVSHEDILNIEFNKLLIPATRISIMESKRINDELVYEEIEFVDLTK
jgi:2'-5' RNA ligase